METTTVPITNKTKAYASSAVGILHAGALVSSFITFVCNESLTACTGYPYCPVPRFRPTYIYFSAVALSALLISGAFYILHCSGMYNKLRCSPKRKLLVELSCISGIVFFYAFGNLFMITRTGNNIVYMVSTFFGFVATSMLIAQLVLIFRRSSSRLIAAEQEIESSADIDSDDSASPDAQPNVQVTVIKSWKMGDHSPGNLSFKNNSSFDNLNLEDNSIRNLSLNSSSSSRRENPSMVDNEDYCTSSSPEDNQVELKNKLSSSD